MISEKSGTKLSTEFLSQLDNGIKISIRIIEVEDLIVKFTKRIVDLDKEIGLLLEQKNEYELAIKFLKDHITKID